VITAATRPRSALARAGARPSANAAARAPGSAAIAAALELRGLHRDDAGVLVQAFGPLVYARAGTGPFDHVARHARLGDPTPLSLAQLRDATLVELSVERITSFENQAPFLDYIERADPSRELVVLARAPRSGLDAEADRRCQYTSQSRYRAPPLEEEAVVEYRNPASCGVDLPR
jgi:hypothetical protein